MALLVKVFGLCLVLALAVAYQLPARLLPAGVDLPDISGPGLAEMLAMLPQPFASGLLWLGWSMLGLGALWLLSLLLRAGLWLADFLRDIWEG